MNGPRARIDDHHDHRQSGLGMRPSTVGFVRVRTTNTSGRLKIDGFIFDETHKHIASELDFHTALTRVKMVNGLRDGANVKTRE